MMRIGIGFLNAVIRSLNLCKSNSQGTRRGFRTRSPGVRRLREGWVQRFFFVLPQLERQWPEIEPQDHHREA
jgi:hypothetical protein